MPTPRRKDESSIDPPVAFLQHAGEIMASSATGNQFAGAAVPRLFEQVMDAVQEQDDRFHRIFNRGRALFGFMCQFDPQGVLQYVYIAYPRDDVDLEHHLLLGATRFSRQELVKLDGNSKGIIVFVF